MSDGKQWPVGIVISTLLIVAACAVTIYIALLQPVQEDRDMMTSYQSMDGNANDIIIAGIRFNSKYKLTYTGQGVSQEGSVISYKLVDINENPVNDAVLEVVFSRPVLNDYRFALQSPRVENGNYYFDNVKVPQKGRWNILTKVSVGTDYRHMNLKSETTDKDVYEYGFDKPMRNYAANGGRTL